jgi:sugar phosphate isomerase/epimerase
MRHRDLTISLITDEVSPSLDEGLAFAREEGIDAVDLRVIDGRNVLALSRGELTDAAQRVRTAGLSVSCICTPLLKWSPPGRTARAAGDQFGFELGDRAPGDVFAGAFAAAELLGARNLRVFSYLAYDGYCVDDLREPIEELLVLADKFDIKVHVENEGVCNIAGFAALEALVGAYRHPRLRALPDIANAHRTGNPPSAADLARLLPFTDFLHIKDYANAAALLRCARRRRYPDRRPAHRGTPGPPGDACLDHRNPRLIRARRHHTTVGTCIAPRARSHPARLKLRPSAPRAIRPAAPTSSCVRHP